MKLIYKIALLFFMIIAIAGCKRSFLDEQPFSFYSQEIYTNPAGANAALNGAYAAAANFNFFGGAYPQMLSVTGLEFRTILTNHVSLNTLDLVPGSAFIGQMWDRGFETINRCNGVIKFVGEAPLSTVPDKNNIVGQAYFLRSVVYFNLVRLYGKLPLHLEPVDQSNINLPMTGLDSIYNTIISDLKNAEQLLPEPARQAVGRPHKFAAPALLGKVYITLAGNDPASPYWQNAKNELLKVKTSNSYSLLPKFADLWDVTKENSIESIFEIQYSAERGTALGQHTALFMPTNTIYSPLALSGQPFARIRFNKEMYEDHLARYTASDPRFNSIYLGGNIRNRANTGNIVVYPLNKTNQGWPYNFKFNDPAFISDQGNHNYIYLRYADVLLMLAETENEINGPGNAYQYVNEVLSRARTSVTPASAQPASFSNMSKDEFRTRIMLERRYELAGEMHQWYDIRRRGYDYYLSVIRNHNNNPNFAVGFDFKALEHPKTMLLPIPDTEINRNTALSLKDQNPGY